MATDFGRGGNGTLWRRASGVLAHPTSLPGRHGCGDLGPSSTKFLRFLGNAAQRWWQMLPVGPAGYGNSPYSAESAFAGSPLLVALEPLVAAGLLRRAPPAERARATTRVDFARVAAARQASLRAAFAAFEALPRRQRQGLGAFQGENEEWLDDYCLFRALKRRHGGGSWTGWPVPLRDRSARALTKARDELRREITYEAFVQYLFAEQWRSLRESARAHGVALMGDVPLYLAHDSADVWSHRALFRLDKTGMPTEVAGVPPDYFSATGQRWGNPLYAWRRHEADGFKWWTSRLLSALARFDAVRLDHFIGLCRYWEIDARYATAEKGRWRRGPGTRFFDAIRRGLGHGSREDLPLVAEDLGVVGPDVVSLRDRWRLPGMKVLQFAFGDDPAAETFLPHTYRRRGVVYTGTHDNDTTVGWYSGSATEDERRAAIRYLGGSAGEGIHWRLIRVASASVASISIFPLQDLLGLDSNARMNHPGTVEGNWSWRATGTSLSSGLAEHLADITRTYGRALDASAS